MFLSHCCVLQGVNVSQRFVRVDVKVDTRKSVMNRERQTFREESRADRVDAMPCHGMMLLVK